MATSTKPPMFTDPQVKAVNGTRPPNRDRSWHEGMMLGVGLTAGLALVAIIASVIALANKTATTTTIIRQATSSAGRGTAPVPGAAGRTSSGAGSMMGGSTSAMPMGSGSALAGAGAVIPIVLQKDAPSGIPGTITGKDGWPRYSPSSITVPAGKKVTLVITNYDDVATPLTGGLPYNRVMGGSETVNGKPVHFVGNKVIAHTFTVTGLGLNVAIPKAPAGGSVTVTFTFIAHKAGTYTWQCYSPCGSGNNGTAGPMMTNGFMQGTFRVV
jgi:plastocyanin